MESDREGFWYPKADAKLCNNCGRCERVCPLIDGHGVTIERSDSPQAMAVWNTDHAIRLVSSSGGVFSALASQMLKRGGSVAGAVYAEDHSVYHILTNDPAKLDSLRRSKYLQSYTGELFNQVSQLLENGKQVLICGTPCQIAGLYKLLGKDYERLLTCDFICRGVNSPKVFLKYIEMLERDYGARAIRVDLRNKTFGWHRYATRIDFANGKTYIKELYDDLFMIGFLQHNCYIRPSCHNCRFKEIPRQADITIADFWGLEKSHPEWDNDSGTSAVLLNSQKGRDFFKSVGNALSSHECTLETVVSGNPALKQSVELKPGRDNLFADIDAMPFDKLLQKHFPLPGRAKRISMLISAKAKAVLRQMFQGS